MTENEMWLLMGRLSTLLHEATHEPRGGGFDLRVAQVLDDFDRAWNEKKSADRRGADA